MELAEADAGGGAEPPKPKQPRFPFWRKGSQEQDPRASPEREGDFD